MGSVMLWLGSHRGGAGLAVVLDKGTEEQPNAVIISELKDLVLDKVSGDQMVVFVEENAKLGIIGVRDVDTVLVSKKPFRVDGPVRVGWTYKLDRDWIGRLNRFDVGVKLLNVHDGDGSEDGKVDRGCSKG